jgi:hypothetical protein
LVVGLGVGVLATGFTVVTTGRGVLVGNGTLLTVVTTGRGVLVGILAEFLTGTLVVVAAGTSVGTIPTAVVAGSVGSAVVGTSVVVNCTSSLGSCVGGNIKPGVVCGLSVPSCTGSVPLLFAASRSASSPCDTSRPIAYTKHANSSITARKVKKFILTNLLVSWFLFPVDL